MKDNKMYWYGNMAGAVAGWLFIIWGMLANIESGIVNTLWWITVLAMCIGHPLELFFSIPVGEKAGIDRKTTIIKTMIFGFTWWVPLKSGVIER